MAWFQSRTKAGGSELWNGRNRVTGLSGSPRSTSIGGGRVPARVIGRRTDVHPNGVDWPTGSRDADQHVVTLDLHFVNGLPDLRTQRGLAGPDIELPAVPGAGDRGPFDGPIGQWAPLMRADPVDCRDHALDIIDRVNPALELDFLGGSRGELIQSRQLDEARHLLVSGPFPCSDHRSIVRAAPSFGSGGRVRSRPAPHPPAV